MRGEGSQQRGQAIARDGNQVGRERDLDLGVIALRIDEPDVGQDVGASPQFDDEGHGLVAAFLDDELPVFRNQFGGRCGGHAG
jgi:hypothetical protein